MGTNILKGYRETNHRLISFLIYLILGIPILAAGLIKFINPSDFASSLKYSFYLPDWLSISIAIIIPITEIIIGLSLIFNLYRNLSIIIYRLLLISFLVFHIWNYFISTQKPCNCFGNLVEFNGIWMMIIIFVLLVISFVINKINPNEEVGIVTQRNFSKINIVLAIIVSIFMLTGVYIRWQRIEKEMNTGLISHTELPSVKVGLQNIFEQYFSDYSNEKFTLLLFLRGKSCASCLEELEFWKDANIYENVNIVGVFMSITEDDKKWFKEVLKIPFDLRSIKSEYFLEIVGKHPAIINRFFLTSEQKLILAKASIADYKEKKDFQTEMESLIN